MIPLQLAEALIAVGNSDEPIHWHAAPFSFVVANPEINTRHWNDWKPILGQLTVGQIVLLLKGLTLAEKEFRWSGGSVASTIWVFRHLYRVADAKTSKCTADWIVSNTVNRYAPFGTTRHSSFDQWVYEQSDEYKIAQERARQLNSLRELEESKARLLKQAIRQRRHEQRCSESRLRGARRLNELTAFNRLNLAEKLTMISSDWDRSLHYWPDFVSELTDEDLSSLPNAVCKNILKRLSPKPPQPWRDFRSRLKRLGSFVD